MSKLFDKPFSRFESLGDNCEFGFFLRMAGNEISSFFRWTSIGDFHKLNSLIINRLENAFVYDDLKPLSEHMVLSEKHKIGFHTRMKSHVIDGERLFKFNESVIKGLYLTETLKVKHLRTKFLHGLTKESKIYVVKGANSADVVSALSNTIKSFGRGCVLHVVSTDESEMVSKVIRVEPNLYMGFIDQFADYNNADKVSFNSWSLLLKNAEREII
ncbi:hypothetical protein P9A06_04870 [Serratia marcescens]|uniref:hypothetical protein n=1 Tax=Serratia marcescens TaxID=615 RepID=UPI003204BD37